MTVNIVSIIFFIIAGVSLLVAIYSFVRFNIPQIIGELSGRTAKKSIAQMRNKNVKTGDKSHRPSPAAKERGTLTDKIENKNRLKKVIKMLQLLKKAQNFLTVPKSYQVIIKQNCLMKAKQNCQMITQQPFSVKKQRF